MHASEKASTSSHVRAYTPQATSTPRTHLSQRVNEHTVSWAAWQRWPACTIALGQQPDRPPGLASHRASSTQAPHVEAQQTPSYRLPVARLGMPNEQTLRKPGIEQLVLVGCVQSLRNSLMYGGQHFLRPPGRLPHPR